MSYQRAGDILPEELLRAVQQYVDGAYLYIPRRELAKRPWGSDTDTRRELAQRNCAIYADYSAGITVRLLAEKYFLSVKSVQRIIRQQREKESPAKCTGQ